MDKDKIKLVIVELVNKFLRTPYGRKYQDYVFKLESITMAKIDAGEIKSIEHAIGYFYLCFKYNKTKRIKTEQFRYELDSPINIRLNETLEKDIEDHIKRRYGDRYYDAFVSKYYNGEKQYNITTISGAALTKFFQELRNDKELYNILKGGAKYE